MTHILPKHKLKKKIDETSPDKVVSVGGDGTITRIGEIVAAKGKILGILPGGSANGMAKELNIPLTPEESLHIIDTGVPTYCDAININNNTCLHLSDIGMNAQLIKYFDEGKLRGKMGYAKVILKTLLKRRRIDVALTKEGKTIHRNAVMVVLANASKYGTGAVINPIGEINDGVFEVVIVKRLSVRALLKMLVKPGLFNPKHIEVFHCQELNIRTRHRIHFQIDGEYLGRVKAIKAAILPSFIKILLPKQENE